MYKPTNDKENAIYNFMEMIKESWTWARLTEEEKNRFNQLLSYGWMKKIIGGTYKQRWEILQGLYNMYLEGMNYKPSGWREPEEVPLF